MPPYRLAWPRPTTPPDCHTAYWTVADAAPGRVEVSEIATPYMGIALDDPTLLALGGGAKNVATPSLVVLGDLNERAYGQIGGFTPLVRTLADDDRIRTYGLRDGNRFVCVAMTFTIDEDVSISYLATEGSHCRQGLASQLLLALLAAAREQGRRSATLQASTDGLAVYERLGFRTVATLRGFLRPPSSL